VRAHPSHLWEPLTEASAADGARCVRCNLWYTFTAPSWAVFAECNLAEEKAAARRKIRFDFDPVEFRPAPRAVVFTEWDPTLGEPYEARRCECGAASTGARDFAAGHAHYCPVREAP
jgi:hypothetical protein